MLASCLDCSDYPQLPYCCHFSSVLPWVKIYMIIYSQGLCTLRHILVCASSICTYVSALSLVVLCSHFLQWEKVSMWSWLISVWHGQYMTMTAIVWTGRPSCPWDGWHPNLSCLAYSPHRLTPGEYRCAHTHTVVVEIMLPCEVRTSRTLHEVGSKLGWSLHEVGSKFIWSGPKLRTKLSSEVHFDMETYFLPSIHLGYAHTLAGACTQHANGIWAMVRKTFSHDTWQACSVAGH